MRPHLPIKPATPTMAAPPPAGNHDAAPLDSHFLHAGQVFVSGKGESIVLILGSCVGVCMWDALHGIGGATHYLLPSWDGSGGGSPRYGNVAISTLVQKLLEAGAHRGELRAKVFGGGCLFESMREPRSRKEQHLGSRNVEVALEVLAKAQIPVVSTERGVNRGQRIVFRTDTGQTLVGML